MFTNRKLSCDRSDFRTCLLSCLAVFIKETGRPLSRGVEL